MVTKDKASLIAFKVSPVLRERLESEAMRNGVSVSAVIRLRLSLSYRETDKKGGWVFPVLGSDGEMVAIDPAEVIPKAAARRRKKVRVLK